jgi:hypothetical protein
MREAGDGTDAAGHILVAGGPSLADNQEEKCQR